MAPTLIPITATICITTGRAIRTRRARWSVCVRSMLSVDVMRIIRPSEYLRIIYACGTAADITLVMCRASQTIIPSPVLRSLMGNGPLWSMERCRMVLLLPVRRWGSIRAWQVSQESPLFLQALLSRHTLCELWSSDAYHIPPRNALRHCETPNCIVDALATIPRWRYPPNTEVF